LHHIEVLKKIEERSDILQLYIKFNDDKVYAIIIMISLKSHFFYDDYKTFGAYYGYQGGGVNDGGFFKLSSKDRRQQVFNYQDLEDIEEEDANILEALMKEIWNFVDDQNGEGDLTLTYAGNDLIQNNGGKHDDFFTLNNFDRFLLNDIELGLSFKF